MAQEVTKTDPRAVAVAQTARVRSLVASLYPQIKRDQRGRDTLPRLPDVAARKELQDYRRDLHGRLQPLNIAVAQKEAAVGALMIFLGGYGNLPIRDLETRANYYAAQLGPQPLFALIAALDDFREGRVYDPGPNGELVRFTRDHAPSAGRILDQAKKHSGEVYEERYRVTRLLSVERVSEPEVSEAERERVAVQIRALADYFIVGNDRIRAQEREKIRAEADAARTNAKRIVQEAAARRRSAAQAEAGQ